MMYADEMHDTYKHYNMLDSVHIILSLREPVRREISAYRQKVRDCGASDAFLVDGDGLLGGASIQNHLIFIKANLSVSFMGDDDALVVVGWWGFHSKP